MLKSFGAPALATLLFAFIGFAIQIQMTIGQSADSIGLRVNLCDVILPIMGILVLGTLLFKKTILPRWHISYGLFWPIALTGLVCFALWNGHRITGEWSHWAIINKFAGWFILMAYFGFGAWVTTNFGQRSLNPLLKMFLLTCIIISFAHMAYITLADVALIPGHPYYRLSGLMGNTNAMSLLLIGAFTFLIVPAAAGQYIVHPFIYRIFMALLPLMLIYNESRAGWIAVFIPVIGVLYLFRKNGLKSLMLPAVALLITLSTLAIMDKADLTKRELRSGDVFIEHNDDSMYAGDYQRLRVLSDSIEFFKQHPLLGIGLGSFLHMQKEKYDDKESVALGIIDSSPLWVMTEFGVIGILMFSGFYILSLRSLSRTGFHPITTSPYAALRTAMILLLLAFAAMSLFHELLYTRFIWLFLGMTLAVSREELKSVRPNP